MEPSTLPPLRQGVLNLPRGLRRVLDADEEVFLLYTCLAALDAADGTHEFRGLGFLDSKSDTLSVSFVLKGASGASDVGVGHKGRKGRAKRKAGGEDRIVEVELVQDKTALRSRKGDTGSVLWKASIDFAQMVLQQYHSHVARPLLDSALLREARIVELGAGTGLLGIVLSPLARHYTATDIPALVPLIRKNLALNIPAGGSSAAPVDAEPLDWTVVHDTPLAARPRLRLLDGPYLCAADLILVVDCVYHPALIPPLLATLDHLACGDPDAEPGTAGPVVLVVVELRAHDVVCEFLERWLALGPEWEIWSLNTVEGDGDVGDATADSEGDRWTLGSRYAVWAGWKQRQSQR